jgi:hypothetical protein
MSDELPEDLRSALRECASFGNRNMVYRFRQASMRKLETKGFVFRPALDARKWPEWYLTDAGRAWITGNPRPSPVNQADGISGGTDNAQ